MENSEWEKEDKKVLSIQDISCFGSCSTTVALPIIAATGVETAIIPSAILSTHTGGFKGFTFRDLSEDIPAIAKHWQTEGIAFDALYTGYLGDKKQIDMVIDIAGTLLKKGGICIIDPVMADHGKLYTGFDLQFVEEMKRLCKHADILLPNLTEACFLSGTEYRKEHDEEYIRYILYRLSSLVNGHIILKGINSREGKLGIAIFDTQREDVYIHYVDRINATSHGTGDCFAAAFVGAYMRGKAMKEAVEISADFVSKAIEYTLCDESHWYGVKFEKAIKDLIMNLA